MQTKMPYPASPGVSYLEALVQGLAEDLHPNNARTQEVRSYARAEANNLSRFIIWAVVPLARGEERDQFQQFSEQLQRLGTNRAEAADFPAPQDKSDLLLDRLEEWGLRFERRIQEFAPTRAARAARDCDRFGIQRGGAR